MMESDTTCSKSKDSSHKKQTPCGKSCDDPPVVVDGSPPASVCCESLPFGEDGAVSAFATPCAQSSVRPRWSAPPTQARLSSSAASANHIELMIRFIGKDTRLASVLLRALRQKIARARLIVSRRARLTPSHSLR